MNLDEAVHTVTDRVTGPRPVVLIDGRSGSGKSTLAAAVAAALDADLVRLDDLYPGWDGLEAGSRAVWEDLLPHGRWRPWDWHAARHMPERRIDPARPLVVEGCGALSRSARSLATLGVWIELDAAERHRRAIARDGESYEREWDRWAAQEDAFYARERSDLLADVVVDGRDLPV
ncbi:nucleoside/nucleotide kinase family protein [Herbiconiux sp. SYSU D00978]|uniref:ATP-binding protein n=1 Tax=Herbiconiux sp. SYSU D00978 TaxID=2812562 RepID=UPI001A95982A|nr:ATP-binding protein [Herbiconiux sp. SYSU D00978]